MKTGLNPYAFILAKHKYPKAIYLLTKQWLKEKNNTQSNEAYFEYTAELFDRNPEKLTSSHHKINMGKSVVKISRLKNDYEGFMAGMELMQTGERELIQRAPLNYDGEHYEYK